MQELVVVTGGSGFIGLNLQERLLDLGYDLINLDIREPEDPAKLKYFRFMDINDRRALCSFFSTVSPDYVVNLAARTDLDGAALSDYVTNIGGVENLCIALSEAPSVKKVLFASSMLVCRAGHIPSAVDDYSANTAYGRSKVRGEQIVQSYKEQLPDNLIFRPTSIWGPQFNHPYRQFFDLVLSKKYLKVGERSGFKTYGFVVNAVNQIISLMTFTKPDTHTDEMYYIGDAPPMSADKWSEIICQAADLPSPMSVPFPIIVCAGVVGDILSVLGFNFPITTFRIKNMTTNNDLSTLICAKYNRYEEILFDDGVQLTLSWLDAKISKKR